MRQRQLLVAGLLVVMVALATAANMPPTMDDQYVTTVEDRSVAFELRAQDGDIDPLHPETHPLWFVLLDGPHHGVLVGNLADVLYEGPHDAVVAMTYIPATGYVGIDTVTLAVFDPFDETASGTVTIQIDIAARRSEGLLSGNWSMNATWESQSGSFSVFATQLTEVYRIGPLTMKGVAQIRKAILGGVEQIIFDTLRFDGEMKLGTLSVASTLGFDPEAPVAADLFDYWRTTIGFGLQGLNLRYTSYLGTPVTSSYQTLYAQAKSGSLSFTNTLRFDMEADCRFVFSRNDTSIGWRGCDMTFNASLGVSCNGFEQVRFSMSGLPMVRLLPTLTLDTQMTFTETAKTLAMSLNWRPLTVGCIRLYGGLDVGGAPGAAIEGFEFYGVRLECKIGDVKVVSATSLDPTKNATMTGQSDYFELVRMSGTLMGCCDLPGTWGIATYFYNQSSELFDWGMLTGTFDLALNEHTNVSFTTVLRSGELGDPRVELSFGFVVRW